MKYFITFLLLHLFLLDTDGQKLVTISIDPTSSKVQDSLKSLQTNLNRLKRGDFYRVEIKGVNQYYYNFTISTKDTTLESKGKIPTLNSLPFEAIVSIFSTLPATNIIAPVKVPIIDSILSAMVPASQDKCEIFLSQELNKINEQIKIFNQYVNSIKQYSNHSFATTRQFNYTRFDTHILEIGPLSEQIDSMHKSFLETSSSNKYRQCSFNLNPQYDVIDSVYVVLKNKQEAVLELKKSVLSHLSNNLYDHHRVKIQQLAIKYSETLEKFNDWQFIGISKLPNVLDMKDIPAADKGKLFDSIVNDRNNLITKAYQLKDSILRGNLEYLLEIEQISSRYDDISEEMTNRSNAIISAYNNASTALDSLISRLSPKATESLLRSTAALLNSSNTVYTDMPRQITGDHVELTVAITPKDSNMGLNSYLTTLAFPSRKKYFFGSGTSMYIGWLRNDSYSVQSIMKNDTTTSYSVVEEDSDEYEVGTYVHANFVWNIFDNEKLGIGVSLGPGVSFTKTVRPRVLAGVSISYGNINKAVLSFGAISGYVDRLSKSLDTSTEYMTAPENIVVSRMQTDYFGSLGFVHSF